MPNTDDHGKEIPDSILTVFDTVCPKCGGTEFEMRNYELGMLMGDIHCANCGQFIRVFDAG